MKYHNVYHPNNVSSPRNMYLFIKPYFHTETLRTPKVEFLWLVGLDENFEVKLLYTFTSREEDFVSIGDYNKLVQPLLKSRLSKTILIHNHPDEIILPSKYDMIFYRRNF